MAQFKLNRKRGESNSTASFAPQTLDSLLVMLADPLNHVRGSPVVDLFHGSAIYLQVAFTRHTHEDIYADAL